MHFNLEIIFDFRRGGLGPHHLTVIGAMVVAIDRPLPSNHIYPYALACHYFLFCNIPAYILHLI